MRARNLLIVALGLLLGACASGGSFRYPAFTAAPRVAVSGETVSLMTEVPATDYYVPDSQVFIGGRSGASTAGMLFGVFGVMAGMAIDQSRNQAEVGDAVAMLAQRFDGVLREALARNIAQRTEPVRPALVAADGARDVLLLPSARFHVEENNIATVAFRLTSRFADAAGGGEITKNYYTGFDDRKAMRGPGSWTENGGAALRAAAERAMERLAHVAVRDIAGDFNAALEAERMPTIRWRVKSNGQVGTQGLLGEHPEYFIVVPMGNGPPIRNIIFATDRGLVDVQ
ncbi:MAG: hypothetical protein JNK67_21720 [Alphaproteobacteria bacterium]|nr:hypothetical protein [Alphaproteobacteria bacterium]